MPWPCLSSQRISSSQELVDVPLALYFGLIMDWEGGHGVLHLERLREWDSYGNIGMESVNVPHDCIFSLNLDRKRLAQFWIAPPAISLGLFASVH
jgi:hypothetical protein